MQLVNVDLQDGHGIISVAVCDIVAAARLRRYFTETGKLWDEIELLRGVKKDDDA